MQIPTNPMYDISSSGTVSLISSGEIIPEYISRFKKRSVKIRGKSHKPASHSLDRLMLNTYKPLPNGENSEWKSIWFHNENRNDIRITNLDWSDEWYYPFIIPGITAPTDEWILAYGRTDIELRICSDEVLIRNFFTKVEIGYRLNKDGYCLIKAPTSTEVIRLHRLVALTFLPHPIDTDHLSVNHKDSVKTNNIPFNLEWATYSENNSHAFAEGPRGSTIRKIRVLNLSTKSEIVFSGYNEAARYLNVKPGSVHSVMDRRRFEGHPYKGHVLKYDDDLRSWEELKQSGPRKKRIPPEEIAVRNMKTGKIKLYSEFTAVTESEEIPGHTLFRILSENVMIPWRGRCFQAVKNGMMLEWPSYPEEVVEVYRNVHSSDRPVRVTDAKGNIVYYSSITKWCMEDRQNRCDPAVLSRYMKKSNKCQWRDWVFEHIDLNTYLHT